jgi:UDP-N-acetylglucosamine--dolichyl-phosphate N-acetylglucosaminephosphotransferase
MRYLYLVLMAISFIVTLYLTPWVIKYMRRIGVIVKDLNKKAKPLVPISGGFAVLAGVFISIMFIVFVKTFVYKSTAELIFLLAATTTIIFITLVGFIDDLLIKKSKESSAGLRQWQKPLLTLSAAIPLMVVNAGSRILDIPILRRMDIGLTYPLLLIPIGVVIAANMVNMLAGFNGMETGMGIIYLLSLGLYSYFFGTQTGAIIAFATLGALVAFYPYNKFPAKILPGDSLTYLLGGVIACTAILGNVERAAIIISIPFVIEFFLKARSKFKAQSYGYAVNGKVHSKYRKIYSIPHIFTRTGKFTEKQISLFMILIELFFAIIIWFLPRS